MKVYIALFSICLFASTTYGQRTKVHNGVEPLSDGILNVGNNDASTNTEETILLLQRNTSGTAASGIGGSLLFKNEISNGLLRNTAAISGLSTNTSAPPFDDHALKFEVFRAGSVAQEMLFDHNGLGIGTLSPTRLLHLEGGSTSAGLFYSRVNYSGTSDVIAIQGHSTPSDGFGIAGSFTGGYKAIDAYGSAGSYTGTAYGTYTSSTGTAGTRIGLYARASGGSTNLAARFGPGDVEIQNNLEVQDDLQVGSSTQGGRVDINNVNQVYAGNAAAMRINAQHNSSQYTYGSLITANSSGTGNVYGLWTSVDNSSINGQAIGVLASALGAGDYSFYGLGDNYFSGDVRIGTQADPDGGIYKLIVDGRILAEEMRIQNSTAWPDYVFADDYDLMSLADLEKSIKQHRHLPGIPSAEVVEAEGVEVGDIQIRMMEKIEELTLYIIQQQKEIEELKNELKKVKQ